MSKFHVIELAGKFIVKSDTEVLAVMDSRLAAETACAQLNWEPGRNPCDVFMAGRWSQSSTERKEAV